MKKIFFGISMMLLSALSFTTAAQSQESASCCKENCKQEQCDKSKKCDKDKKCDKSKKCDKKFDGKKCPKDEMKCGKFAKKCCKGDSAVCDLKPGKPVAFHHGNGGAKHMGHKGGFRMGREQLFSGIELTDTQKTQIEALDAKMAEERKVLKEDASAKTAEARAEAKKAAKQAREAYNLGLKEILNEEQYAKYQANMEAMKFRKEGMKDFRELKQDIRKVNMTEESASK